MSRSTAHTFFVAASLLLLAGCGGGGAPTTEPGKPGGGIPGTPDTKAPAADVKPSGRKDIAVIPKSTAHEFWRQVGEGAQDAVKGHDFDIVFKAGDPGDRTETRHQRRLRRHRACLSCRRREGRAAIRV